MLIVSELLVMTTLNHHQKDSLVIGMGMGMTTKDVDNH